MTTKFEYLLNEMENAAALDNPAALDYYGKRQAVLQYVAGLESLSAKPECLDIAGMVIDDMAP